MHWTLETYISAYQSAHVVYVLQLMRHCGNQCLHRFITCYSLVCEVSSKPGSSGGLTPSRHKPISKCFHAVFIGNPGTGKTTVAKYYGQILANIGLLSRGEIMAKNPADFIGEALGESEQKTKAILDGAKGYVLIIDEAYGLSGASSGGGGSDEHTSHAADSYKSAIIDTLVAEMQSTAGEDRCVLLLGYKESMEKLIQAVNPVLGRRFPAEFCLRVPRLYQ